MAGRLVEGLEVVVVELDLRPVDHREAQAGEDLDDVVERACHWMPVAERRHAPSRQGHVEALAGQLCL